jgi:aspartate/methionine/tyrosine aminotransferase
LERRDGYPADISNLVLTNGASEGVRLSMMLILREAESGFRDGVLTPVPQYPLYSALSTVLNSNFLPYYLDESDGWNCSTDNLTAAYDEAKKNGICPRALVVINPGNPTGTNMYCVFHCNNLTIL